MRSKSLTHIQLAQDIVMEALRRAQKGEPRTGDEQIPKLVDALDTCMDRQRVIRGKPLPGALKPESAPARAPRTTSAPVTYQISASRSAPMLMQDAPVQDAQALPPVDAGPAPAP